MLLSKLAKRIAKRIEKQEKLVRIAAKVAKKLVLAAYRTPTSVIESLLRKLSSNENTELSNAFAGLKMAGMTELPILKIHDDFALTDNYFN